MDQKGCSEPGAHSHSTGEHHVKVKILITLNVDKLSPGGVRSGATRELKSAQLATAAVQAVGDALVHGLGKSFNHPLANAISSMTVEKIQLMPKHCRPKRRADTSFAHVYWCPRGIRRKRPDYTDAQCDAFIAYAEEQMKDDMIEQGWNSMETLLYLFERERT